MGRTHEAPNGVKRYDRRRGSRAGLKDAPVHVHCIANYRVSAFIYRWRRDVLGMDEVKARAEMEVIWYPEGVWATFTSRSTGAAR
jgi:hypothetical protein